jgi:hypothetical protein
MLHNNSLVNRKPHQKENVSAEYKSSLKRFWILCYKLILLPNYPPELQAKKF